MTAVRRFAAAAVPLWLLAAPLAAQGTGGGGGRGAGMTVLSFLTRPKFIVMLIIGFTALALLLSRRMNNRMKVPILLASTFLFGIAANLPVAAFSSFSMHPSPICAATKSILYGFRIPMIVTLGVIVGLTLIGPKLFCGYVCPVGAVQELAAMGADKLKIRRARWNFSVTNGVRLGIFLLFIFLSGTAILHTVANGRRTALSLYDYINAFHGFEIAAQPSLAATIVHFLPFLLTLGLAFKFYRPFCDLVCPIGLFANWLEQIAMFRVTFRKHACDDCRACERKAPCPALAEILKESTIRPDCFACTACLQSCVRDSLAIGIRRVETDPARTPDPLPRPGVSPEEKPAPGLEV